MSSTPELVEQYLEYVGYLQNFQDNNEIDLSALEFIFPTTMLPLSRLILENPEVYTPPDNYSVSNYVDTIISGSGSTTYAPVVRLPRNKSDREEALQNVYRLQRSDSSFFGGISAMKYVVQEMTDNIYDHSNFNNATTMAQKFGTKGYADLCFYDDGITIPASIAKIKNDLEPYQAIAEAINGLSTKDNSRGFGLRTSIRLCTEGLKGEVLVVSGGGAVYFTGSAPPSLYKLTGLNHLNGTLVTLRVSLNTPEVNIYGFVE